MKPARFQISLKAGILLLSVAAVSVATFQWLNPASVMPEGWNRNEIVAPAVKTNETVLDSDILAWQIGEDERPMRSHACLVWLHLRKSNGKDCFRIALTYRNENGYGKPLADMVWNLEYDDQPTRYVEDFSKTPSDIQIREFIDQAVYMWKLDGLQEKWEFSNFQYIDGRVRRRAWKRRTGKAFD